MRPLPDHTGGAIAAERGEAQGIVLDPRLGQQARNVALTHELVHLERGILPDGAPADVVRREERAVRRESAGRLIADADLFRLELRAELDAIEAWEAAEELDVPVAVLVERLYG